jgi:hypothetical protein
MKITSGIELLRKCIPTLKLEDNGFIVEFFNIDIKHKNIEDIYVFIYEYYADRDVKKRIYKISSIGRTNDDIKEYLELFAKNIFGIEFMRYLRERSFW